MTAGVAVACLGCGLASTGAVRATAAGAGFSTTAGAAGVTGGSAEAMLAAAGLGAAAGAAVGTGAGCVSAAFSAAGAGASVCGARAGWPSALPDMIASSLPATCMPPASAGLVRIGLGSASTTGTPARLPPMKEAAPANTTITPAIAAAMMARRLVLGSIVSRGRGTR